MIPTSIEAEKAVIGCMLIDRECLESCEELGEKDFVDIDNQMFASKIKLAYLKEKNVDLAILSKYIDDIYIPKLMGICMNVVTTANFNHYFKIIKDMSRRRKMIEAANKISKLASDTEKDSADTLEEAENDILSIAQGSGDDMLSTIDGVSETIAVFENRIKNKGQLPGLSSGFKSIDIKTCGFRNGSFNVIAARPSMGKTAMALNIADKVCSRDEMCMIFSLEMTREQLFTRMLSSKCMIKKDNFDLGLSQKELEEVKEAAKDYTEDNIKIDDTANLTIAEIKRKARRLNKKKKVRLIIIDYLQLMEGNGDRREVVERNSRGLKLLAKEIGCPVICLSQLSRACEQRNDKRPMLSDLRETGAIEQDADFVAFLYRDEYYNPGSEKGNIAEFIIAKNREGSTGTIELYWEGCYTRFFEISKSLDIF